jgi:hypothetical protein
VVVSKRGRPSPMRSPAVRTAVGRQGRTRGGEEVRTRGGSVGTAARRAPLGPDRRGQPAIVLDSQDLPSGLARRRPAVDPDHSVVLGQLGDAPALLLLSSIVFICSSRSLFGALVAGSKL